MATQQAILSNGEFLSEVERIKGDILHLSTSVSEVSRLHQSLLSDPGTRGSSNLEAKTTETQVQNTKIRDDIKRLETDAARSRGNPVKDTQVRQLKNSFQRQLQDYRVEEASYENQYREQIKRQYQYINENATESELNEAAEADWGDEGVFATALRSNRSATASSTLGAVRARHNDIQKIEQTIGELNRLMEDLATTVVLQEEPVQNIEQQTANVKEDTEAGNTQLSQAIKSARNARKLKFWLLGISVAIVVILALILGLVFGLRNNN